MVEWVIRNLIMKWYYILIWLLIFGVLFVWWVIWLGFYLSQQNPLEKADAIVVVSGGETKARAEEGAKLYNDGWAPVMIFSGAARDQDKSGVSNAKAMAQFVKEQGVPDEAIILEEHSKTTFENAVEVAKIIKNHNWKKIILVTSPYHQRRTKMTFEFVLGKDYTLISRSATDSLWRKNGWWKSFRGWYLSVSEFQKIIFIYTTGNYG